jgi:hypothetical protein
MKTLTKAQVVTIYALAEIGGWAGYQDMKHFGGLAQSADALHAAGLVERREVPSPYGFSVGEPQWRLVAVEWLH